MGNQDNPGEASADQAAGAPDDLAQQRAAERQARAMLHLRRRPTEAPASPAARSATAPGRERQGAERDRPRGAPKPTHRTLDRALLPPPPPRKGPGRALAALGVLALAGAALAWATNVLPGLVGPAGEGPAVAHAAPQATPDGPTRPAIVASTPSTPLPPALAASALQADKAVAQVDLPPGAVALPPLTPEAQLAAAPTAAGPVAAPAPVATAVPAPPSLVARLRKALDGEGIAAPVDVDATSGRVSVADPQADPALRDRTDMLIRAVYAGANLPEPQIEHRWMSPMHGGAADAAPTAAAAASLSAAEAYAARHAAREQSQARHKERAAAAAADAEALRPVLPEGRITASCRQSLAGHTPQRADMTACMKRSCCASAARHNAEDCRAYEKAYPFTCGG